MVALIITMSFMIALITFISDCGLEYELEHILELLDILDLFVFVRSINIDLSLLLFCFDYAR